MDSVGAVIGPLLSLVFVAALGLRASFALTIIPGVLAAILIAALIHEGEHKPPPHIKLLPGISYLPEQFRRYLVGVGVAGLGDFSNTLLILWATQAWTPRFGMARAAHLAMLFYVGYNVVYAASCYVSGQIADRYSKNRVLAVGYRLAAIPALALVWPGASLLKFVAAFGFSGPLYGGVGNGRKRDRGRDASGRAARYRIWAPGDGKWRRRCAVQHNHRLCLDLHVPWRDALCDGELVAWSGEYLEFAELRARC
jgi:predicted MFS family arabinose efflux permease